MTPRYDFARIHAAGALASGYFHTLSSLIVKNKGPQDVVSKADLNTELLIKSRIAPAFPQYAFPARETALAPGQGIWVAGPIDGTKPLHLRHPKGLQRPRSPVQAVTRTGKFEFSRKFKRPARPIGGTAELPVLQVILIALWLLCWPTLAAAQPLCHGRYQVAQEMLDATYDRFGTLYSGGPFASYSGADVGPTIDLWRLWRGLPDLRFRDARQFDHMGDWGRDFSGFGDSADDLTLTLRIAARPQATGLTDTFRYVTARYLNSLVDAGSAPGWFLAPGPTDQTARQRRVLAAATPGSLMEWLLVTMALSDTPQAVAWVNQGDWDGLPDDWDNALRDLIRQRATFEPGLDWQATAMIAQDAPDRFARAVQDCTATPAEYALHVLASFHGLQRRAYRPDLTLLADLPPVMRHLAMANLAMVAVHSLGRADDPAARGVLDWIAAQSPSAQFTAWLTVGRVWVARDLTELIALTDGTALDWRVVDALNLLSLNNLAQFAGAAHLPDAQRRLLVTTVAARAFVLGDQALSRRFLTDLPPLMPDYAAVIDAALTAPAPAEVQNALALLALPRPTVWLRAQDDPDIDYASGPWRFSAIDLPWHFVSAGVLNRDLRVWMAQPLADGRYDMVDWRAWRRGRTYNDPQAQPFVPDDFTYGPGYPFLRHIAWDQLGRLDTCHGLTQRLSAVLVAWADQSSDSWLDSVLTDQSALPEVLRRVIQLNRRSPGALIAGRPAGQRAFALLSGRFADSHAAANTPYWYHQDRGCTAAQTFPPG